jgi:WD40 repeat protein
MVAWNSDDSLVATAQNNCIIKIWNSNNGRLVHELKVCIVIENSIIKY